MRNKEKLLPCPLCGGEAVLQTVESHTHILKHAVPDCTGEAYIECSYCGCGIIRDTEQEAIKRWNNRKGQQSNSWISCDDRLPPPPDGGIPRSRAELENAYVKDIIKEYIVMIEGAVEPTTLFYGGENRWYDFNGKEYEVYPVIAWQPLPEPYTNI